MAGNPGLAGEADAPRLRLVSRSNAREHWSVRHARDKREAGALRAAWTSAGLAGWIVPLPCSVTLARLGGKEMDGDNLQGALKAVRDAAAKLIGVDDADDRVKWRYRQDARHRGGGRDNYTPPQAFTTEVNCISTIGICRLPVSVI